MAHAISYQAALEWALDGYRYFKEQNERIKAKRAEAVDFETFRFLQNELRAIAAETCGEQAMICRIYGMSEERVHDDLEALLARDNELVYV